MFFRVYYNQRSEIQEEHRRDLEVIRMLTKQQKHEQDMQRIREFRLFDDDFLKKCFEDHDECAELVLRIIMNKEDLKVLHSKTEYVIQNLQGRSVRLDVKATDSENKEYDIEVQRADKGAGRKRARHNSSMLDANALAPQEDVNFLSETYVIFITEHDVIGKGEPIYRVERKILETDEFFDDGSHILYVNGAYRGDSDIGKLMHDFSCTDADDMFYGKLADRVRYFKEDAKGVESMCKAIEEMRNQEREEVTREFVVRMIRDGETSVEKMARYSGLSLDEVKEIVKQEAVLA